MSSATSNNYVCQSEDIAAYLDGELEASALSVLEQHVKECSPCAAKLQEQRHLLCALDFALGDEPALALPKNFAQVVATHAQADMSGIRHRSERGRALRLCAVLAVASFALLGGAAASESVLKPIISIAKHLASFIEILFHALYGAGAGLAMILRTISGHLILESQTLALFAFLLLAIVVALLPRLIASYHRAQVTE